MMFLVTCLQRDNLKITLELNNDMFTVDGAMAPVIKRPVQYALVKRYEDICRRRLGHMNSTNMKCFKVLPGSRVSYTDAVSHCGVCPLGKCVQKVYPKTTSTSFDTALELVKIDLMGPIGPTAKGGFRDVNNCTDYYHTYIVGTGFC